MMKSSCANLPCSAAQAWNTNGTTPATNAATTRVDGLRATRGAGFSVSSSTGSSLLAGRRLAHERAQRLVEDVGDLARVRRGERLAAGGGRDLLQLARVDVGADADPDHRQRFPRVLQPGQLREQAGQPDGVAVLVAAVGQHDDDVDPAELPVLP